MSKYPKEINSSKYTQQKDKKPKDETITPQEQTVQYP